MESTTFALSRTNANLDWTVSTTTNTRRKLSGNFKDYLSQNFDVVHKDRSLQAEETNRYVPSYEGTVSIGFSVHVPYWELDVDKTEQERLESLVMLFLCSQGVEMVVSTAQPNVLFPVCPFNNNGNDSSVMTAMAKSDGNSVVDRSLENMIVWNLPKFTTTTLPFQEEEIVEDMVSQSFYIESQPSGQRQQYYTQIVVTYPVYQWGEDESSVAQELQDEFNNGVVRTGVLDSLLPWPNAVAAAIGSEPYVFWDEPLPSGPGYYDTTIPFGASTILQYIGVGLMGINTLVIILLQCLSHRHAKRLERLAKLEAIKKSESNEYLDTEAGVSALLMESKHYALSKSNEVAVLRRSRCPSEASNSSVEVGLKQKATTKEKEDGLLQKAKNHSPPGKTRPTPWYTETNLLGSDDEDNEAEHMRADLQILNLSKESSLGNAYSGHSRDGQTKHLDF